MMIEEEQYCHFSHIGHCLPFAYHLRNNQNSCSGSKCLVPKKSDSPEGPVSPDRGCPDRVYG